MAAVRNSSLAGPLALLAAAPAAAQPPGDETIIVRFRHSYAICAGFCPHFEMKVAPDGWVVAHSELTERVYRYRVGPNQAAHFRRILSRVRPAGHRLLDRACEPARTQDGAVDPLSDPRHDDVEVRWTTATSKARLTSCGDTNRSTRKLIARAVIALGAELLDGRRKGSRYS